MRQIRCAAGLIGSCWFRGQSAVRLLPHSYGIHTNKGSCSWFDADNPSSKAVTNTGTENDHHLASSSNISITKPYNKHMNNNGNGRLNEDLMTFLYEVGTSQREARYWLHQFKKSATNPLQPFAVIQVDQEIFNEPKKVEHIGKSVSFLHRNGIKVVLTLGYTTVNSGHKLWSYMDKTEFVHTDKYLGILNGLFRNTALLVDAIETEGAETRPMFNGNGIIKAQPIQKNSFHGEIQKLYLEPISWSMESNHIPIVQAVGFSESGQLLLVDPTQVTEGLSKCIKPRKVMFLNNYGGIRDSRSKIVSSINLPSDLDHCFVQPWCNADIKEKIQRIASLINYLPDDGSIVVTSGNALLKELFTHHGAGTYFKSAERILTYDTVDNIDVPRLVDLLSTSFGSPMIPDYFNSLKISLHKMFISESYSAVAIITKHPNTDVPYLCKFAVDQKTQGLGTGEMMWAHITRKYPKLFWRCRADNNISAWYFQRADGSWSNGEWVVFWYGEHEYEETNKLVTMAMMLPESISRPTVIERID
ncbi:N-acetylglutamate synthase, mitochondrial-like [Tubulanus polymorphus]|uniref:N-acetylglutamate synthase, mitochondrial-like n=1 Tax=Tubulanus polymorphus TaxID=672921 RepID=UPI003DA2A893